MADLQDSLASPMSKSEEKKTTAEKPDPIKLRGSKAMRHRQNIERIAFVCTLLFCGSLAFGIWYTDGALITKTIRILEKAEPNATQSRNPAVICADPRNKNTPFCQDRAAQADSDWNSMSRVQGGKTNQFALHGKR